MDEDNDYSMYKKVVSKDQYFKNWTTEISDEIKNTIFNKHLLKCEVFQRDSFKCQNAGCITPESPLTMHHVKHQRNGGKDKARNCVTLCRSCHKAFNRGKRKITFANVDYLPSHIAGITFSLDRPKKIDWKKVKSEMKSIRRELKHSGNYMRDINFDLLLILMKWLESCEFNDDDDD